MLSLYILNHILAKLKEKEHDINKIFTIILRCSITY